MANLTPKEMAAVALARMKQRAEPAGAQPELISSQDASAAPAEPRQRVIEVSPEQVNEWRPAYEMLTDRQRLFVDAILEGATQTKAAIAAGFEGVRPDDAGSKMAKNELVRRALQEQRAEAMEAAGVSRFAIRMRLAKWVHGDETLDSDALRVGAAKILLDELDKDKDSTKDTSSVADAIRQRFQRARLVPNGQTPPSHLKLVK